MNRVLGIKIANLSKKEIAERWDFFLNDSHGHFVTTPNPEIILAARKDEEYFYILNEADLAIADGFGIILAGLLQKTKFTRLAGSDLTPELLGKAEREQRRVLVLNWKKGLSDQADITQTLKKRWPKLEAQVLDIEREAQLTTQELAAVQQFAPQLIFSTLGAPWQEKLLWRTLPQIPSARLALGVGGSFDFLTGKAIRAAKFWRSLGLEWLWRLIKQPRRLKRIWQAVVVFSWKVIKENLINPWCYRRNVVILIYRLINQEPYVLIVERQDDHGHWQLPQGGTDGESLLQAGLRETREELGVTSLKVVGVYPKIHTYRFVNGRNQKTNYKGQKQGLLIAEFLGDDEEVKINYWDHCAWRWVKARELLTAVHPVRRPGVEKFLKKFWETIKYE